MKDPYKFTVTFGQYTREYYRSYSLSQEIAILFINDLLEENKLAHLHPGDSGALNVTVIVEDDFGDKYKSVHSVRIKYIRKAFLDE